MEEKIIQFDDNSSLKFVKVENGVAIIFQSTHEDSKIISMSVVLSKEETRDIREWLNFIGGQIG